MTSNLPIHMGNDYRARWVGATDQAGAVRAGASPGGSVKMAFAAIVAGIGGARIGDGNRTMVQTQRWLATTAATAAGTGETRPHADPWR
jgi:hypothetical protein